MDLEKIDRYEIQRQLGRGGMATVYLARDPRFQRDVAIKVLPRTYLHDPMFRARFQREAQTIASLEHPAIVPVHDFGEQDGQPFLVMAYMPGGSLADRLDDGQPLAPADAGRILRRISAGLDEAHRQGIVHRDLKPANILFDRYDNAYLSDFGIVKVAQATSNLTGDAVIGTPSFMSPEQARGDEEIDGRSDIYALGAILYTMLSGRVPYEAETPVGVLIKHINAPIPNLSESNPHLAPAYESVIQRSLAKEPGQRYQTANELVVALDRVIGGQAKAPDSPADRRTVVESYPDADSPMEEEDPASQGRRSWPRWVWALGALFLISCVVGVAVAAVALPPALEEGGSLAGLLAPGDGDPDAATIAVPPSATETNRSPTSEVGEEALTEMPPGPTPATGESGPAPATATEQRPPTEEPPPTATSTPPTPTLTPVPEVINGPIVFDSAEEDGFEIFVMQADGTNVRRLTDNSVRDDEADFSSDGRFIAFEQQRGDQWMIMVMASNGTGMRELVPGRQPDWSPDDRFIAFETASFPQQIHVVEVASGNVRQVTNRPTHSRAPSWSPNGERIAFMTEVDGVWQLAIANVDNGLDRVITRGDGDKRFPVWSPDGRLIAYNTLDTFGAPEHIWVVEPSGDNPRRLTEEGQNGRPAWSPDGRYLLFNSNRNGRWLIYRMDRDGSNETALTSVGDDQRADWGRR